MGYSVIYLENHKCKVCEAIKRNVIEPVAVFVPEGEKENLKSEFKNLNSEQLEEELEDFYQNIRGKVKREKEVLFEAEYDFDNIKISQDIKVFIKTYKTCIFHCEKENEIWMENYNDGYEEFAKRTEIKWNEDLIEEFWRRIQAYRFAVDYKEKWDSFEGTTEEKWKQLKQLLPEETQKEIENDRYLILFNLENLEKYKLTYNFKNFMFPKFRDYEPVDFKERKKLYITSVDYNFFYPYEELKFKHKANFTYCQFYGNTDFGEFQFNNEANFIESKFYSKAYFGFTRFYDDVYFWKSSFNSESEFVYSLFYSKAYFSESQFHNKVDFIESHFCDLASFSESKFYDKVDFNLGGKNLLFDLSSIKLLENSEIEIKNLKTCRLVLNNISNISEHFLFYDTEITTLKDYQKYAKENNIVVDGETLKEVENSPNLEIVNSHLNQMKFINCDFSKANHIKIESSDLTEVKFLATDWGDISEKRICPDIFKYQTKKARDVYRQLKLTLDNHRDYFSANGFYALEMKAQEKMLEETLGFKKKKDDVFQDLKVLGKLIGKFRKLPKEKYELLVLKIHKLSSDYGQSWTKPLMWLFTISFITSFIFQFGEYKNLLKNTFDTAQITYWSYEKGFLTAMWEVIKLYFKILELILSPILLSVKNIAEITKTIKGEFDEGNLWIILLLFIYTVVSGFLIYQFAGAVRRRVKR